MVAYKTLARTHTRAHLSDDRLPIYYCYSRSASHIMPDAFQFELLFEYICSENAFALDSYALAHTHTSYSAHIASKSLNVEMVFVCVCVVFFLVHFARAACL